MIDNVRMTAAVPVAAGVTAKTEGQRTPSAAASVEQATPASASVSRLLSIVADLKEAPAPVDFARIAQLRRAIADGSYQVNPQALSSAIVAYVLPK